MGASARPRRRGWWRGPALAALVGAALLSGGSGRDAERPGRAGDGPIPGIRLKARVVEVTDGDTVVARLRSGEVERVRSIGIDTPESDPRKPIECFGLEAKAANERLTGGRRVTLVVGAEPRDDYARLLAYVRLDDSAGTPLVNALLVRRGLARTLTIAPNDALAPLLRRLEAEAGRAGRGLWGRCGR